MHGIHRVAVRPIDTVAIVGTGAVGLTQGQMSRALAARQVIIVARRAQPLRLAQACGAAAVGVDPSAVNPVEAILDLTDGAGADVVFETSGSGSAIQLCCELAAFGGRIGITGLLVIPAALDTSTAMRKELDLCWITATPPGTAFASTDWRLSCSRASASEPRHW